MTVETYNGMNIYCVRQEGGGVTYDVGTSNGRAIYQRGFKTRAEAIAYIDELTHPDFIKNLLAEARERDEQRQLSDNL